MSSWPARWASSPAVGCKSSHERILRQDPELSRTAASRPREQTALPTGTVTFAFVDVVDASDLWSRDATEMASAMATHHARVREISERHGGSVFAQVGDSFGVCFAKR